jgi:hypothetical protein
MRKFRVWDKEEKEYCNEYYHNGFMIFNDGDLYMFDGINNRKVDQNRYIVEWETGLKDKHKDDLYEGDIVEFVDTPGKTAVIKYNKDDAMFNLHGDIIENFWDYAGFQVKIIGNIHEEAHND